MIKIKYCLLGLLILSLHSVSAQEMGKKYTLRQLINNAVENNYLLQANEKQRLIKRSEFDIVKAEYLPKIDASLGMTYWKWLLPNKQKILGSGNTDVVTELSIKQTLYNWGEKDVKKAVVNDEIELNTETQRQIRNTIVWGVSNAYVELLKIKSETSIYRNSINQLEGHLRFTENLYNIGKSSMVDVLRIKVQISVEKKRLQRSINAESSQKTKIKRLCNLDDKVKLDVNTDVDDIIGKWFKKLFVADVIYNKISENHPVLKSSNTRINIETKQKKLLKLKNLPKVFSYGVTSWEDGYVPFGDRFNYNIGIGVNYTLPFFAGANYKTRMIQSDYKVEQLDYEKKQIFLDLKKEVDLGIDEWKKIQDEIKDINSILKLSKETLDNAVVQYKDGQGKIIDVLDAQSILTKSFVDLQKSKISLLQVVARLHYLSGNDTYPF